MADGAARPRHPMAPEDNLCVRGGRFSATTTTTDAFPALSEAEARAARPASSFKPERSAATGLPFRADTTTASSFVDYGDLARTARPGPARLGATLAVEPAPFAATTTTRDAFRRYDSAELGPPTSARFDTGSAATGLPFMAKSTAQTTFRPYSEEERRAARTMEGRRPAGDALPFP